MQINWLNKLQEIPAIKSAGLHEVKPFDQGLSNPSFLVNTQKGQWVVRLNRPQAGVNRALEAEILQLIEPLKITPTIIENNPKAGYLISEYIPKPTWIQPNFADTSKLKSLQSQLKRLHDIQFEHIPSRLDQRIKTYLQTFKSVPAELEHNINKQLDSLNELNFWQACNTLCHYDLNPNNIIGEQPWIIDWEFAGQGHPLIDWLIMEHETGFDYQAYYPDNSDPEWIYPLKKLIERMMVLWQLNQA